MSRSCNIRVEDIPKRRQVKVSPEEWTKSALDTFWTEFNRGSTDECFIPGVREGQQPSGSGQLKYNSNNAAGPPRQPAATTKSPSSNLNSIKDNSQSGSKDQRNNGPNSQTGMESTAPTINNGGQPKALGRAMGKPNAPSPLNQDSKDTGALATSTKNIVPETKEVPVNAANTNPKLQEITPQPLVATQGAQNSNVPEENTPGSVNSAQGVQKSNAPEENTPGQANSAQAARKSNLPEENTPGSSNSAQGVQKSNVPEENTPGQASSAQGAQKSNVSEENTSGSSNSAQGVQKSNVPGENTPGPTDAAPEQISQAPTDTTQGAQKSNLPEENTPGSKESAQGARKSNASQETTPGLTDTTQETSTPQAMEGKNMMSYTINDNDNGEDEQDQKWKLKDFGTPIVPGLYVPGSGNSGKPKGGSGANGKTGGEQNNKCYGTSDINAEGYIDPDDDIDRRISAGRNKMDYFLDAVTGAEYIPGNECECQQYQRTESEDDNDIVWEIVNFLAETTVTGVKQLGSLWSSSKPKDECVEDNGSKNPSTSRGNSTSKASNDLPSNPSKGRNSNASNLNASSEAEQNTKGSSSNKEMDQPENVSAPNEDKSLDPPIEEIMPPVPEGKKSVAEEPEPVPVIEVSEVNEGDGTA